ncbi:MAG TPA: kelch repeat-containing protein [Chitinophagaceae bacterium]|jgi:N-acetylneuraminic acid mutarotase|nr:kelch repeat-containing protein [Chitinophagaceae bacterium]
MKKINVLFVLLFTTIVAFSQIGPNAQWTWIKGDNISGSNGTYSGLASDLTPGARDGAATWVGADGKLWLFGGQGYSQSGPSGYLSDLWYFDVSANNWVAVSGDNGTNQLGVYAGPNDPSNIPSARKFAYTWTDASGNLWLFGGQGNGPVDYNDLWKYDPVNNIWNLINGTNNASNTIGNYPPVIGTANASGVTGPGSREYGAAWTDGTNLYLFGGLGYDGGGTKNYLNDVWSYDIANNTWTWLNGSNTNNQFGIYSGTQVPGSRIAPYSWYYNGKLFLFGGYGYGSASGPGYLNDMWQYDPSSNSWIFVVGSNSIDQNGVYGTAGTPDVNNQPGGRSSGITWMDGAGSLGIFGGRGRTNTTLGFLNDVWRYNTITNEWTWEKGEDNNVDQTGVYGTLGVTDATSHPGSRRYASGWTDTHGFLWLFGGTGSDDGTTVGTNYLNDLWRISDLVLPVKYISFTATKAYGSVQLDWVTAQEINTRMFVVEHSANGKDYWPIGNLAAAGNSSEQKKYHFVDTKPQQGINYYRLKLINTDSKVEYSDVRQVTFTGGALSLSVVGNPFRSSLQFRVSSPTNEKATIQLSDINGKTLLQKPVELQTGDNVMSVDGSGFAAGIYILSVNSSAGLRQVKVVKQ